MAQQANLAVTNRNCLFRGKLKKKARHSSIRSRTSIAHMGYRLATAENQPRSQSNLAGHTTEANVIHATTEEREKNPIAKSHLR